MATEVFILNLSEALDTVKALHSSMLRRAAIYSEVKRGNKGTRSNGPGG